ncbi:IS30 family transposase [Amycolatopsis sp. NPDC005232]|uniref:IS30 family transposase n=1 Tax=Amycolatopsis sp. NPDC005232 TaxID=3157027 RepID=UPI0033B8F6F5
MVPAVVSSRFLSLGERIRIADRVRQPGISLRTIAAELGRPVSTIARELHRNRQSGGTYQPHAAHELAAGRRARPKVGKLVADPVLRAVVQDGLDQRWSPQQIARRLRRDHPDRSEWHVTCETIYQALYVQARGGLRREVAGWLRSGRVTRRPHVRPDQRRPRMATEMLMISDRPPEVADRAVPGHWEGDLIMGAFNRSAIGTLVERATRYVMLLHLPDGYAPSAVRDALIAKIATLPAQLRRSLTWDQGSEMHLHGQFTQATSMPVYFCDPHAPWQRGSNENTNGLLRQYFPKGTDLAVHTAEHLNAVAAELNDRPRMTLNWDSPTERMTQLLTTDHHQQCRNDP